ncbi:unnamed protein product [Amoebophrya sp. A25]|nr:unnamed protein product [Amoebophrya sp. A25]|eukprot:GSA25T00005595001.1
MDGVTTQGIQHPGSYAFMLTSKKELSMEADLYSGGETLVHAAGGVMLDANTFPDGKYAMISSQTNHPHFKQELEIKPAMPIRAYLIKPKGTQMEAGEDATTELRKWTRDEKIAAMVPATQENCIVLSQLMLPGGMKYKMRWPGDVALLILAPCESLELEEVAKERSHLSKGTCALCGWTPPDLDSAWHRRTPAEISDLFCAHIDEHHAPVALSAPVLGDKMELVARQEQMEKYQQLKSAAKAGRLGSFRRLASVGPRRYGWKRYAERYSCDYCGLTFQTNLGAMEKHVLAHQEKQVIKVAKLVVRRAGRIVTPKLGAVQRAWRPEGHLLCATAGAASFGPDARLAKFLIPRCAWKNAATRNQLICKKCEKWDIGFDPLIMSMRMLSKRVDLLRAHERKCKGGKKGVKKS